MKHHGEKAGSIPARAPKKSMARSSNGRTSPRVSSSSSSDTHRATDTPSARQARTADGCSVLVEDRGNLSHVQVTMADGKTISTTTRRDPRVVAEELKRQYRHDPQATAPSCHRKEARQTESDRHEAPRTRRAQAAREEVVVDEENTGRPRAAGRTKSRVTAARVRQAVRRNVEVHAAPRKKGVRAKKGRVR